MYKSSSRILRPAFVVFLVFVLLIHFETAKAAMTPISVAIVPPLQFPPSDYNITGARLSLLWGRHRDVYGIDVGVLGNVTDLTFVGLSVSGLFNITYGSTTIVGLQLAGLTNLNYNKTEVVGIQSSLLVNYNEAASQVSGLQLALGANLAKFTDINGIQLALYNQAKTVRGFQIGLVNVADSLTGVQIGLLNFHLKGTFFVSPIINVGF